MSQVTPMNYSINHAVLERELGVDSSFGELNMHELLDDPRARETDERTRLGKNDVTKHSETGSHTASSRVGQ